MKELRAMNTKSKSELGAIPRAMQSGGASLVRVRRTRTRTRRRCKEERERRLSSDTRRKKRPIKGAEHTSQNEEDI